MIIASAILCAWNLLNAYYDASRINKFKPISHTLNGVVYLVITGALIWWMDISPLFLLTAFTDRQLFFDIPLNLMRKPRKPWNYVTEDENPAFTDKMEIKIFGRNGTLPNVIYLIIWVATLIANYNYV